MDIQPKVTLQYLFFTFLKIGTISWGGFMALISVVQTQLVEKDKKLSDEVILDGISLASVLPGPVAFNVVSYVGYYLRGIRGALVSMIAIILPSFILILIFSYIYFHYSQLPVFDSFFKGILPAIAAIIISVAINMTRKNIKDYKQAIILGVSGLLLIVLHSFYTTIVIMVLGGGAGFIFYKNKFPDGVITSKHENKKLDFKKLIIAGGIISFIILIVIFLPDIVHSRLYEKAILIRDIIYTFSGMSLTLFGGGYVIIPTIQEVIVNELNWLTTKEFVDAIAMGQITPGPIFISATFIGYKVGGLLGAIAATLAVFFPPAFLMIFLSRFLAHIKDSKTIISIFKGLRPAIIGMIFAAAYTIGKGTEISWPTILIFIAILVLSIKYKVNVVYLIPLSGLAGVLFFNFV